MNVKFFRLVLSGIVLLNFCAAQAQDYAETALLFSRTRPGGSARIQAMGGSQIALGGDYSSGLSNPAGLGMFNRSEATLSTAISSHTLTSGYMGNSAKDNRTVLNIPGFSLALHIPKENGSFLGGTFGISFSRINDFNSSTLYSGPNHNNSIIDYFIDQANGRSTAQFDENASQYNTPTGLAYFNYLIGPQSILDPPGPDDRYFTDASYPDLQKEEILVKGSSNQWTFSYGANFNDIFFIGAGVGVASIRYKSEKIFSESFDSDTLSYLELNENLDIQGSGVNATIGAIVRPVDFLQFGVSVVTPTFYTLSETYDASMRTRWNRFDYYGDGQEILTNEQAGTDILTSDYNLTTPFKFSTGIAFISKYGLITGDLELVNPSKARYSANTSGISYSDDNDNIRALYRSVVNYRVGAEGRFNIFRVRAGYGVQANTYRSEFDTDNKISTISGGAGVRTKKFYVDFALLHSTTRSYYYQPYVFSDGSGPVVRLKKGSTTGMVTVGFTF